MTRFIAVLLIFVLQMSLLMGYRTVAVISKLRNFPYRSSAVRLASTAEYDELLTDSENALNAQKGRPIISWYPGHIAKAERELSEYIKKVDVVIEVRDARIPHASTHPMVPTWVGSKPLIVAIARLDQVSPYALQAWKEFYAVNPAHEERPDAKVFFIDGKLGTGVHALKREALKAGQNINEKRQRKGIQPRAVRAAVIGFPNVGKSALINRLLGRKMAVSRNMPGVTKSLRWVRLGGDAGASDSNLELLDSPGIIPAKQFDPNGAYLLAMCNDIGEASYDRVVIASALCDELNAMHRAHPQYVDMAHICERYKLPFDEMTGDEVVHAVSEDAYKGNAISAADKILGDFRKGLMKYGSLEAAVLSRRPLAQSSNGGKKGDCGLQERSNAESEKSSVGAQGSRGPSFPKIDVGKGNYEGW
jgi:ribosome biogenesis GTPase A